MTYEVIISWREYRKYAVEAHNEDDAMSMALEKSGSDDGEVVTANYNADVTVEEVKEVN